MRPKLTMAESMPGLLFHGGICWDSDSFSAFGAEVQGIGIPYFFRRSRKKNSVQCHLLGKLITIKNKHVLDTGRHEIEVEKYGEQK